MAQAVWVYTRLSEDKKKGTAKEGATVARQRRACEEWARDRGIEILGFKSDNDVSATRSSYRKGFEQLLKLNPPAILVWHQDRLLRKTKDLERVIELGVPVYSVTGGILDLSTPQGRAVARTVAAWSTFEGEHRDERQGEALDEIYADREPVPGKPRFGYLGASKTRRVNCKIDPKTAPIVKAMFETVGHDDLDQRRTILSWAEELKWRPRRVRDTLTNKAYYGVLTRRGVEFEAADHVDRIIDKSLFDKVQGVLASNIHAGRPGGVIKHLASGIARCGVCEGPMHFRNSYLCLADLSHPTVKKEYVERKVRFEIVNVLLKSMRDPKVTGMLPEIEARLSEIDTEESDWADAQASGMKWSLIAPHVQSLVAERQRLQDERKAVIAASTRAGILSNLRAALVDPVTRRVDMDAAGALRREITSRFEALDIRQRRELVAEHLTIVVNPGRGPSRVHVEEKEQEQ